MPFNLVGILYFSRVCHSWLGLGPDCLDTSEFLADCILPVCPGLWQELR